MSDEQPVDSPWLTSTEAGLYIKKGRRFVLREIRQGRLRGATIGGRREVLTRREWLDQWALDRAAPIAAKTRTRWPESGKGGW